MKFCAETEKLFKKDLTLNFDENDISAEVIADSWNPNTEKRLTTLRIKIPRIILPEFNTHRIASKSFASSRAIPTKKLRQKVYDNPFVPVYFGVNQSGMMASESLKGWKKTAAKYLWKLAGRTACKFHWLLEKIGVHKQTCNRIIEPWLYVTGTISSTEWDNFFKLRYDTAAQPEIIILAKRIHDAIVCSEPVRKGNGEVHLPWIDKEELDKLGIEKCIKISVARCARSSYDNNLGKKSQPEEDLKLYNRLLSGGHFSAFEHIAISSTKQYNEDYCRNFRGWYQYRAFVDHKNPARFPLLTKDTNDSSSNESQS